jgi:hypothetical protein
MIQQQNRAKSNLTLSLLQMGANRDHPHHFSTLPNLTLNLNSAVAGLKMAHLLKITVAFEFSVLTLTVPGLRLRKIQNPSCF